MGNTGTNVGFGYQGGAGSVDLSGYAKLDANNVFTGDFNTFQNPLNANSYVRAQSFNANANSSTLNGSTSGTAIFSQPFRAITYKQVIMYWDALLGFTATYTFPTAFTHLPAIVSTNGLSSALITTLTTTGVVVTGATSTGFLILEGF